MEPKNKSKENDLIGREKRRCWHSSCFALGIHLESLGSLRFLQNLDGVDGYRRQEAGIGRPVMSWASGLILRASVLSFIPKHKVGHHRHLLSDSFVSEEQIPEAKTHE